MVLGTALATLCGLLLPLGLATRGASKLEAAATTAPALTFVSEGDYDATYAADIDADGRYVTFTDGGSLLLRDQAVATTTTLPTPGLRYAQVPTISGDARLVGFVGTQDVEATSSQDLYVVDRAGAGGEGVLRRVTGTPNDLPYQRQPPCDQAEAVCPPHLSRDGKALVSPASFSVVSPNLSITADPYGGSSPPNGWQGPLVDLGNHASFLGRPTATAQQAVRVEVEGPDPVTFPASGPSIEGDAAFGVGPSENPCEGTLAPGDACTIQVTYTPPCTTVEDVQHQATLRLPGTTPAGQAELALIAHHTCAQVPVIELAPSGGSEGVAETCSGEATVTGPLPSPVTERTDHRQLPVFPLGELEVGRASLFAMSVTNWTNFAQPVTLRSPGCAMRLVVPPSAPSGTCLPGANLPVNESCVAYVEARSSEVAALAGALYVGQGSYRLSATAVSNAALLWRDPSGQGNFGSTPPVVVSQAGSGGPAMDGREVSVSAEGRWVAFTSYDRLEGEPTANDVPLVYVHDTDALGDGTWQRGPTVLASRLPDGSTPPSGAAEPSLSGDGRRLAFVTIRGSDPTVAARAARADRERRERGRTPTGAQAVVGQSDQVWVRDLGLQATARMSSTPGGTPGDAESFAPALSGDGSTVTFASFASNLLGEPRGEFPASQVYAREVGSDLTGGSTELLSVRPDGTPDLTENSGSPSTTVDGAVTSFDSGAALLPPDGDSDYDVYTARRLPSLRVDPTALDFGDVPVSNASAPRAVTLTNDGPGPAALSVDPVRAPYGIESDLCDGGVLRSGDSCVVSLTFAPGEVGPRMETLFVGSRSGYLDGPSVSVALDGSGISADRWPGETSRLAEQAQSPAISDDGRYVAARTIPDDGGVPTVVLRDQAGGAPARVSGEGQSVEGGPSISGDGRLVAYNAYPASDEPSDQAPDVWVADTRAGSGGPATPHRASGTASDLPFQRSVYCWGIRDCGPELSGDGTTLVFPALLHPDSPALRVSVTSGAEPWAEEPLVDFDPGGESPTQAQVTLTAAESVAFTGPPVVEGRDRTAFAVTGTTCQGNLASGAACTIDLQLAPPEPRCGRTYFATLRTNASAPNGRLAIPLVASDPCTGPPSPPPPPAGTCAPIAPPPYAGYPASDSHVSNAGVPLGYRAAPSVGTVDTSALVVTNGGETQASLRLDAADCSVGLVLPADPWPSAPPACQPNTVLEPGEQCTAYVGFRPEEVGAYAASLAVVPEGAPVSAWQRYRFYAVGTAEVVVLRQDPSGAGDFAGPGRPAPRIVSVDADGDLIDGAEPSVSGDGRFVAFASRSLLGRTAQTGQWQVYRHDRKSGDTVLVSRLPSGAVPELDAASPSLSRDGRRVAFATMEPGGEGGPVGDQVYVRDLGSGRTVLASAMFANPVADGGGGSLDPSLSDDGTTVAYSSTATNLVAQPTNGERAAYVRYLEPDFANAPLEERFNELVSLTEDGAVPPTGSSARPAIDEDGAFTAFDSSSVLAVADTNEARDVYVRLRPPQLVIDPTALDFGQLQIGTRSAPVTVTLDNAGRGPVRMGTPSTEEPYDVAAQTCATLHRGASCTVQVTFQPASEDQADALLQLPTASGYRAGPTYSVTLTGRGVAPPPEDPGDPDCPGGPDCPDSPGEPEPGVAAISVTPGRVAFAPQRLSVAATPKQVVVRNIGSVPVQITLALPASAAGFALVGRPCAAALRPNQQCVVPVRYAPRGLGDGQTTLAVTANADLPGVLDPEPVSVDLVGATIQPTLIADPGLVRPGRVTHAEGSEFPPGVPVRLTWSTGVGSASVTPAADGTFTLPMLVYRRDVLGPRELVATIPGVGEIRSEPVLVVPLTGQPPDFVSRG